MGSYLFKLPEWEKCFSIIMVSFGRSESDHCTVALKGKVGVAKNPCLNPGDICVLSAVDVPDLHHTVDCAVCPHKGVQLHLEFAFEGCFQPMSHFSPQLSLPYLVCFKLWFCW